MIHISTLIIGAGQAGLAMSHALAARGEPHVLLERGEIAQSWRTERWDSLRLLTPNWQSRLPGHAYSGPAPDGFMTMPEVVAFLSDYAARMDAPVTDDELLEIHRELVKRNGITDGLVYLQVTRGNPGDRDFAFPNPAVKPGLFLFTQSKPGLADAPAAKAGWKIISIPDERWGRRDIKTTQLLYPSLGKMMAKKAGVDDAWLVEDGFVTEGTSNNAYIVKGRRIITRALSHDILHGITRAAVLRMAKEAQLEVEERSFTIEEAKDADEAFVTSASAFVMPVVEIDGTTLGSGKPGPIAARLREIYIEESRKAAV